ALSTKFGSAAETPFPLVDRMGILPLSGRWQPPGAPSLRRDRRADLSRSMAWTGEVRTADRCGRAKRLYLPPPAEVLSRLASSSGISLRRFSSPRASVE